MTTSFSLVDNVRKPHVLVGSPSGLRGTGQCECLVGRGLIDRAAVKEED